MAETQEADAELMEIAGFAERGSQQESKVAVRFFTEPQEDVVKSKKEGRLICEDVEMIEIKIPGDPDIRRRPVKPQDKEDYPKAYLAWKRRESQEVVVGTPLALWGVMRPSLVEEAKFMGIKTVEHLASVTDVNLQKLGPGWLELRAKARDFIDKAKGSAKLAALRDELEKERAERKTLEKMLKDQGDKIDELMKRRG